jgi:hypothetical protein
MSIAIYKVKGTRQSITNNLIGYLLRPCKYAVSFLASIFDL